MLPEPVCCSTVFPDAVLLPGEKENVLAVLDELSGYDTEETKVETAKNL